MVDAFGAVGAFAVFDAFGGDGSSDVFGSVTLVAAGAATGPVRGVFSDIPTDACRIVDVVCVF